MNLKGVPESKNFEDRTGEPWYSPHKLMAAIDIGLKRAIRDPKQLKIDQNAELLRQNPLPPMSQQEVRNNLKARVIPSQGGWTVKKPGSIVDEFIPSLVETPYTRKQKAPDDSGLRPEEQAAIDQLLRRHRQ